ncbi:cobalamin biosynthesis protein [Streptomyces formicae]|uniref:Cobalamin biosynthesis protein n=1 Tax=Streptomyces formicae TaxID=1616117 RepID=A0ABY3WQG7_9ACTN|nr:cobalamin biosynthesis protein [Streptomyces formicae]
MSALVVGVGARRGAPVEEVLGLIRDVLREAGAVPGAVVALATLEARAVEPGIVGAAAALGVPLRGFPAGELARVPVPHPSGAAEEAVGTPSVAEAAALMAAARIGKALVGGELVGGEPTGGGELLVPKRTSGPQGRPGRVTCAIVRLPDPRGPEPGVPEPVAHGTAGSGRMPEPEPDPARRGAGRVGHDHYRQHHHHDGTDNPASKENA